MNVFELTVLYTRQFIFAWWMNEFDSHNVHSRKILSHTNWLVYMGFSGPFLGRFEQKLHQVGTSVITDLSQLNCLAQKVLSESDRITQKSKFDIIEFQ